MNILITGISGFIGTNLTKYLAERDDITLYGVSRDPSSIDKRIATYLARCFSKVDTHILDDYEIDAVVHLAGLAHDLEGANNESAYFEVNTTLTSELLDSFNSSSSCKKFIFLSSVKAIADSCQGILDETACPDPKTPYGKSKLQAEEYIKTNIGASKTYFILRPCMVYGPGNKGNLNLLYKLVKNGVPYPLASFENKRSFLSVRNLCFVISQIIGKELASGSFHISDDNSISTVKLLGLIGEAIDKRVRVLKIPKQMMRLLANVGSLLSLPFNKHTMTKLIENYEVSNKKIKVAIEANMPYQTKEEMIRTIQSFR